MNEFVAWWNSLPPEERKRRRAEGERRRALRVAARAKVLFGLLDEPWFMRTEDSHGRDDR